MNYYKHNIGDFAVATASLDLEEVGIFIRLVDHQVLNEKPIKTQWVSFAFKKEALDKVNRVLGGLFEETADGWVYPPAVDWVTEYQNNAEKNRDNGKKGGRPRKSIAKTDEEKPNRLFEKPSGFLEKPTGNPNETEKKPNHKPLTINQEKEKEEKEKAPRAPLVAMPTELPDEWEASALEARPDVDPRYVYGKIKAKYAGATTRKALTTWRREFLNWIGREFAKAPAPAPKPVKKFTDEYYLNSLNPDGSVNWGI